MHLDKIPAGKHLPDDVNMIIEISAHSDPIKYEIDKASGALFVDRFIATGMRYPCNYGYIPHTLSEDGDPVDGLIITPFPLVAGSVIRCRPVGMLRMTDESGVDNKILAVPVEKLCPAYHHIQSIDTVDPLLKDQIVHFFTHYKSLEKGKWVKVDGFGDVTAAHQEIMASFERAKNTTD